MVKDYRDVRDSEFYNKKDVIISHENYKTVIYSVENGFFQVDPDLEFFKWSFGNKIYNICNDDNITPQINKELMKKQDIEEME
jgi:hypothetical protein